MKSSNFKRIASFFTGILIVFLFFSVLITPSKLKAQENPEGIFSLEELRDRATEVFKRLNEKTGAWLEAIRDIQEIIVDLGSWTEASFNEVVTKIDNAGLMLDEIFPSISGCVKDEKGDPISGATIVAIQMDGIPTYAFAGQGTAQSAGLSASTFSFAVGAPPIAVNEMYLSETQKQDFGPGCYWIPVSPSFLSAYLRLLDPLISIEAEGTQSFKFDVKIIAMPPMGHTISPAGYTVSILKDIVKIEQEDDLADLLPWEQGAETGGTAD
jgi:hypothetical protein